MWARLKTGNRTKSTDQGSLPIKTSTLNNLNAVLIILMIKNYFCLFEINTKVTQI